MAWKLSDLGDQRGRTVVITGGNSGIGLEAARALVARNAHVVIACRDAQRGEQARQELAGGHAQASVEVQLLDLASLDSIRACAATLTDRFAHIDVLINNAGVMAIPRRETADGFEMQLGTNHLGHFVLTALLFERLRAAPQARVVTVSSLAHQLGFINFANLHGRVFYDPWLAYGQSKLANLLFTYELDRRCRAAGLRVASLACHPGIAQTNLGYAGPRMLGSTFGETLVQMYTSVIAQTAADGALPTLFAGCAAEAVGGDYIGPDGLGEMRGRPRKVSSSFMSRSQRLARELWERSEADTGVAFSVA